MRRSFKLFGARSETTFRPTVRRSCFFTLITDRYLLSGVEIHSASSDNYHVSYYDELGLALYSIVGCRL